MERQFSKRSRTLDVEIGGYSNGERSLLVRCLSALSSTDLLVMDRGYPAWWLFALLAQKGISFCARLDSCGCARNEVTSFLRSGQTETIIERPMQSRIKAQFIAAGGVVTQSMTMRIRSMPLS